VGATQASSKEQSMAEQITPDQLFEQMPSYFLPEKAGDTNATIQFDLTGEQGGKWWLRIANGTATSGKGEVENPTLTFTADAQDYVQIALGQLDGMTAFMSGRLKIKGDTGLALKFQSMFRRPG
jgi:putative sterol carrier protein